MSPSTSVLMPNARRAAACAALSLLMVGGLVGCNRSTTTGPDGTKTTTTTTSPMAPASAASR